MGWVGNNSWIHPPFCWRHLVPHNVGNIIFGCYFLNIAFVIFSILRQIQNGTSFRKINSGSTAPGTASKIQYLNIIQIFKFSKNIVKNDQLVFKPWLFGPIWVSKNPGFVHGFPRISHPMDFPPHGFSGRPRERPTKTKIGRKDGGCAGGTKRRMQLTDLSGQKT